MCAVDICILRAINKKITYNKQILINFDLYIQGVTEISALILTSDVPRREEQMIHNHFFPNSSSFRIKILKRFATHLVTRLWQTSTINFLMTIET